MTYTVTINTGNGAFDECSDAEVARILREAADRIERSGERGFNLLDANGNKVGCVIVTD